MAEDAAVNTAALPWPGDLLAAARVRRMQAKLHQWAGEDGTRQFDDLYNLVYDPAFLVTAWERVAGNQGARTAGVDAVTVPQIAEVRGSREFLAGVRAGLKARTFQPLEVRRVMIPKAGGKLRRLGIPTVTDRVVQASLKLVLEPVFEADFRPFSYGFRPGRRAHDAIAEIHHLATHRYEWVLDADIEACFDEISHPALMDRVRARIKDKRVLALVRAFLKSGVLTGTGAREETYSGTPQGGILSPLLANIALSALDEHFGARWDAHGSAQQRSKHRRNGGATCRLVRYADDFVVMVAGTRAHAEALQDEITAVLAPMGLRLSRAKTHVAHIDEGFDFLGFHIQRRRKRGTSKRHVYTTPSKKSIQDIKTKVRRLTRRSTKNMPVRALLMKLNRALQGWANYFRHAVAKRVFTTIDSYAWWQVTHWLRSKHQRLTWKELRQRFTAPNGRIAADGIILSGASKIKITRYRYRGHKIPAPWTVQAAAT
jgi:RNA-directed DNA polymerase